MKNATNVLVVLFLLLGVGFAYAGKGVCSPLESNTCYSESATYYPS